MLPYFSNHFGNPNSNLHYYGWKAQEAVDLARNQIASYFNVNSKLIVFTSGATESNNLAIRGYLKHKSKGHLITSILEHKAVLEIFYQLERDGYVVTYLMPDACGQITKESLIKAINDDTILVSLMMVNNEIGNLSDYVSFRNICDKYSICYHSDASQAIGKINLDLHNLPHLISFSGHKIYAPKGIGGLLINKDFDISPLVFGGGQERGIRSGTLPVPLIVGLGHSFSLLNQITTHTEKISGFLFKISNMLQNNFENRIVINSNLQNSVSSILSFSVHGVYWEDLLNSLTMIAISNGSACNAKSTNPSHVITAIGHQRDLALSTIRISLSFMTTESEINYLIHYLHEKLDKLLS